MFRLAGIIFAIVGFSTFLVLILFWPQIRGIMPAIAPPAEDIGELWEEGTAPLELPPGFSISMFAENLPGARVMALDRFGNMWVSQTREGKIALLKIENGDVSEQTTIFEGLRNPHGLVFDPANGLDLYVAEEHQIRRVRVYAEQTLEKIADLPSKGSGHSTRTVLFGPDGKLYVSVGSSCNVCNENNPRRAAIFRMDKNGGNQEIFARGLRNTVFFTWSYVDGRMWGTDMGRDLLGDDLPPDEINIVREGGDYGWPYCYGKNVRDTDFSEDKRLRCDERIGTLPSYIDIPAHSAPLGLAFIPEEGWPEEMWYDLLVAYHGSWNRTEPTGYKIALVKLDASGNFEGMDSTGSPQVEDFITGWLREDGSVIGRPVDIRVEPGGIAYISDDKAGVIYKLTYKGDD